MVYGAGQEKALIERAQAGDAAAFEALVQHHAVYLYNLALRLVRQPQEAEDMAQEALVRAWQALPRFRGDSRFTTWLYQIVTHVCYNRLPGLKTELLALEVDREALNVPDTRPQIETDLLDDELHQQLHRAIAALPESYRLLISLRHVQEMSYEEISQVTGLPLGTVKTGIFRGRAQLREHLAEYQAFSLGQR